jgi:2-aminoethylphosphonate--pyruvate transaminase/phosphonoacetaldehyde hydrolase
VIFDWAGTTIDYGSFAPIRAFIEGFRSIGIEISNETARGPMGLKKIDHVRAIAATLPGPVTEGEIQRAYRVFEKVLSESIADHCDVKPYVTETVAALRARGIRIGSSTGYTAKTMEEVIARAERAGYKPDFTVAADEVPKARPWPFMVWKNLTHFGIGNARAAVKVGDTVADIEEGRAAGCWTVGVVMGSSELGLTESEVDGMPERELAELKRAARGRFYQAGADYIIDDLRELLGVVADIERKNALRARRKLLTPGPLSTRESVKLAMMTDHCTWDDEYKAITLGVMDDITSIAAGSGYATVLLQGSGSYAVEAMMTNFCDSGEKTLILVNGEYGRRMMTVAKKRGMGYDALSFADTEAIEPAAVEAYLERDPSVRNVAFVHCETTSGVINPLESISTVCARRGCRVLVDAMSSFAAYPIDMGALGVDALAASSNKCLEGVPGLSFVIAKKELLKGCEGKSVSHSLDLYDQYLGLVEGGGKFRFTSPTNVLLALRQALDDYRLEGGLRARRRRYEENHRVLVNGMGALGIVPILPPEIQSCIITTFLLGDLDFGPLYDHLKSRGFIIYPGKLTSVPTFRIGTIGDVNPTDVARLVEAIGAYAAVYQSTGMSILNSP